MGNGKGNYQRWLNKTKMMIKMEKTQVFRFIINVLGQKKHYRLFAVTPFCFWKCRQTPKALTPLMTTQFC